MNVSSLSSKQNCTSMNSSVERNSFSCPQFTLDYCLPPRKVYEVRYIVYFLISAFLTISTICLNSVTVLVYWKVSQLRKKLTNLMIMVLSVTDLGVGIICLPLFTTILGKKAFMGMGSCTICVVFQYSAHVLITMSLSTLLTMSIERYLGVIHPIYHRSTLTRKRLLILFFGISVEWDLVLCLVFVNAKFHLIIVGLQTIITVLAIGFMYARIFYTGHIVVKKVRKNLAKKTILKTLRDAKSYMIVFLTFLACFVPVFVTVALGNQIGSDSLVFTSARLFPLMNSSANSVVFFWRNAKLRIEAWKIFSKITTK